MADNAANNAGQDKSASFLIWGENGWIAGHLKSLLLKQTTQVHTTSVRLENREQVIEELARVRPTHVFNAASCTGRPNVDWCEGNKEQTIRSNVVGAVNLVDCCHLSSIHCTVFATGCIYEYDEQHPIDGPGYTEEDRPNFTGSFYSETKGYVEPVSLSLIHAAVLRLICLYIMKTYKNCLILRLRMPVSDDLHPRSFVTKILKYDRVVNIPNSHTVLHDLLPAAVVLAKSNETGVYNLTNPGAISHNEVLCLFQRLVQPDVTFKNFTLEEQAKVIKAARSNCKLDATKLVMKLREHGVELDEIHVAYEKCFNRMAARGQSVDSGESSDGKMLK